MLREKETGRAKKHAPDLLNRAAIYKIALGRKKARLEAKKLPSFALGSSRKSP